MNRMTATASPLAEDALDRLRKLARGNGLDPDDIWIERAEERICTIEGVLMLVPKVETDSSGQGKPARGQKVRRFSSPEELASYLQDQQRRFTASDEWVAAVTKDIESLPGKGWGLGVARIILDDKTDYLTTSRSCGACSGQGRTICATCHGQRNRPCLPCEQRGMERCPNCLQTGYELQRKDMVCHLCNGKLWTNCRMCNGRGSVPCPACQGAGSMQCPTCKGKATLTENIRVTFGAEVRFTSGSGRDLPAALRRFMDRRGVEVLTKGVAEFTLSQNDEDQKPGAAVLRLSAAIPCAEIVLVIAGKKSRAVVAGTKRVLLDVPSFLDTALGKARKILADAAIGRGALDEALSYRVVADALSLALQGKDKPNFLQRLYPVGLSSACAAEIMRNVHRALVRTTAKMRWMAASGIVLTSAAIFAALFFGPLDKILTDHFSARLAAGIELTLPLLLILLAYGLLDVTLCRSLGKKFSCAKVALQKRSGHSFWTASLSILAVFAVSLVLTSTKPACWRIFFGG